MSDDFGTDSRDAARCLGSMMSVGFGDLGVKLGNKKRREEKGKKRFGEWEFKYVLRFS